MPSLKYRAYFIESDGFNADTMISLLMKLESTDEIFLFKAYVTRKEAKYHIVTYFDYGMSPP